MKRIILDLCGGTGSWSRPYKDSGNYEVMVITEPHYDIREIRFYSDYLFLGNAENVYYKDIYGILAAPPCTMFSVARQTAFKPRDLSEGMELVEICMKVIWEVRKRHQIKFWALENPRGILRQFLGKPALSFQPDEYGELYTKHTDIWGYFNIPEKLKDKPVIPHTVKNQLTKNNRILPLLPEDYILPKGMRSQTARRSMTSSKFAQAFYAANNENSKALNSDTDKLYEQTVLRQ